MSKSSQQDIFNDKKFFLSQSKKNPLFLMRHLSSLFEILFTKYHARFYTLMRGQHLGSKRKPKWLKQCAGKKISQCKNFLMLIEAIPERSIPSIKLSPSYPKTEKWIDVPDHEDYLSHHRFSELINDLILKIDSTKPWILPAIINKNLLQPKENQDSSWETYSTCERICNLLTWISYVPTYLRAQILPSFIYEYLEFAMQWVLTHIEYYGKKTNNHIINNARCLIMAGSILSNDKVVSSGIAILRQMLDKLIKPQGSLRERSSHYQLLVATWLLDIDFFLKSSAYYDIDLGHRLKKIINNMLATAAIFCDDAGYLQAYVGDISPDLTPLNTSKRLMLCYPDQWPVNYSVMTSRDDWYLLKNKLNKVIINCPTGLYPHKFPSHAHNDITSFVWIHKNNPILIDSGRARYTNDLISNHQKSGVGHNLVLINGFPPLCESLINQGNWQPKPYGEASLSISEIKDSSIIISHDGFKRATPVTLHERTLTLFENQLQVIDHLIGSGCVNIQLYWHLDLSFIRLDDEKLRFSNHQIDLFIETNATTINSPLDSYEVTYPNHWQSVQYGYASPSSSVMMQFKIKLPFKVITYFKVTSCAQLQD